LALLSVASKSSLTKALFDHGNQTQGQELALQALYQIEITATVRLPPWNSFLVISKGSLEQRLPAVWCQE
jgi:hypothetical protein